MKKKVAQFLESTGTDHSERSSVDSSAQVVRLHVDGITGASTGSPRVSTGPVDNPLSTDGLNAHAEAMRNELLTRLLAERYSFPTWFRKP